ncbi:MAG: hypothetical protein JXR96_14745 [Deltaproteobacteria bacterium]|nr:hypothetical protein [Deltaproteobacteria bacterium]
MAGSQPMPDFKQKQKMLFGQTPPEQLVAQAERYLEVSWYSDALDFYEQARHAEGIERIRTKVREEGDAFLFHRCLRLLEQEAGPGEWKELADNALRLGKLQFAREGYRMAGENKSLERVDAMISPAEREERKDETGGEPEEA